MSSPYNNPVGFLQEFCQKYSVARFPQYIDMGSNGPDHAKEFSYKCTYDGYEVIVSSRNKKHAKSEAAKAMVVLLNEKQYFTKFNIDVDGNATLSSRVSNDKSNSFNIKKNPISALQEHCQINKCALPVYKETSSPTNGFVCACTLNNETTYATGSNKKSAKTQSASKMCDKLNISYSGEEDIESEEELQQKNSISALMEHCQQSKTSEMPEFTEESRSDNLFAMKCRAGPFSATGTGLTKKYAKLSAANKVLALMVKSVEEEIESEEELPQKNSVSALIEHCHQSKTSATPEFTEERRSDNLFGMKCRVGSFSATGTGLSKKYAKLSAANKVLALLVKSDESSCSTTISSPVKKDRSILEEFSLDDEEEEHVKLDPEKEIEISNKIESLNLTDVEDKMESQCSPVKEEANVKKEPNLEEETPSSSVKVEPNMKEKSNVEEEPISSSVKVEPNIKDKSNVEKEPISSSVKVEPNVEEEPISSSMKEKLTIEEQPKTEINEVKSATSERLAQWVQNTAM